MKPSFYVVVGADGRRIAKRETPRTFDTRERETDYAEIGPFRTRRGAEFMRDRHGPHCVCVSDAEQLAGSWRRVPSVTTGGKSFFWLGKFPGRTVALVWDRSAEGWRMHYGPNYDLRGGEAFPNISEAKRDAQQFALGYPLQPYERG